MNLDNLKDFSRVVIIDDNSVEGLAIQNALAEKGISSVFYLIDDAIGSNLPSVPLNNVRLIFLDLDFASTLNDRSKASVALANLSKIISPNSIYVLILWSSHTTEPLAAEFIRQLKRAPICKPFVSPIPLEKSVCKNPTGDFNFDIIQEKIKTAFSRIPAFEVFSEGERLAMNAIGNVISDVVGRKNNKKLCNTIHSLSIAYAGKSELMEQEPNNALLALNEAFGDAIAKEIVKKNFSDLTIGDGNLSEQEKNKLNNKLLFSPDIGTGSGAIYPIRRTKKNIENIIEDLFCQKREKLDEDDANFCARKMVFVYVDVTPLCGSAQKKGKQYFLTGVIHPKIYKGDKEVKVNPIGCYQFEYTFLYKKRVCRISLNLKTYCADKSLIKNLTPILKLRSNIVVDMQHKIASYISRPGHILLK